MIDTMSESNNNVTATVIPASVVEFNADAAGNEPISPIQEESLSVPEEVEESGGRQLLSGMRTIDVIGVNSPTHGRSCNLHGIGCGSAVREGDKLVCKWEVQEIEVGVPEEVVQVWKLSYKDGLPTCHVGYLPKHLFARMQPEWFDLMFLRVIHDVRVSASLHERRRSHQNYGIVNCEIIRNDSNYNGHDPFNDEDGCNVSENMFMNVLRDISEIKNSNSNIAAIQKGKQKIKKGKKKQEKKKRKKKSYCLESSSDEDSCNDESINIKKQLDELAKQHKKGKKKKTRKFYFGGSTTDEDN